MKYVLYAALLISCCGFTPAYAQQQQQKSCWSCVTRWVPKELHPKIVLPACAATIECAVLNPIRYPKHAELALGLCGVTGLVIGSLHISQEQLQTLLPMGLAGAAGAIAGSCLSVVIGEISPVESAVFSLALSAGVVHLCRLWKYCRTSKHTTTVNRLNSALLV